MSILGNYLRDLRGAETQAQLATRLGCSAALVSSWETGVAVPPQARLNQYGRFYPKSSLDDLRVMREWELNELSIERETLLDILRDIRRLLIEIRDR